MEPSVVGQGFRRKRCAALRDGTGLGRHRLLRRANRSLMRVGLIASEYQYLPQFDDVNGWDLQHARRIRWYRLPAPTISGGSFRSEPTALWADQCRFGGRFRPQFYRVAADGLADRGAAAVPILSRNVVGPAIDCGIVALAADVGRSYWDRKPFGEHRCEDEMIAHYRYRCYGRSAGRPSRSQSSGGTWTFAYSVRCLANRKMLSSSSRPNLGVGAEGALARPRVRPALEVTCDIVVSDGFRYRLYVVERDSSRWPTQT